MRAPGAVETISRSPIIRSPVLLGERDFSELRIREDRAEALLPKQAVRRKFPLLGEEALQERDEGGDAIAPCASPVNPAGTRLPCFCRPSSGSASVVDGSREIPPFVARVA